MLGELATLVSRSHVLMSPPKSILKNQSTAEPTFKVSIAVAASGKASS